MADKAPEFNSGISYLIRMDMIVKVMHEAFIEDDIRTAARCCGRLQNELLGRMTQEEAHKFSIKKRHAYKILENPDIGNGRFVVEEWADELQLLAHKKGLVMPDKAVIFEDD